MVHACVVRGFVFATCLLTACSSSSNSDGDDHDQDRHHGDDGDGDGGDDDIVELPPFLVDQQPVVSHGARTLVTYTPSGASAAVSVPAMAGEVVVLTSPETSASAVNTWAQQGGYTVGARLPAAGFYLLQVSGDVTAAITAAQAQAWVSDAFPNGSYGANVHATCADGDTFDASGQPDGPYDCTDGLRGGAEVAAVDLFKNHRESATPCVSHGAQIACEMEQVNELYEGGPACDVDIDLGTAVEASVEVGGDTSMAEIQWALAGLLAGADNRGHMSIINLSVGPNISPACDATCYRAAYKDWLSGIAALAVAARATIGDKFVFTLAAGNAALDVTTIINEVRVAYPTAFENILLAASATSTYQQSEFTNRSQRLDDLMYAYGDSFCCEAEETRCGSNGGTSFAAPQLAMTLGKVLEDSGRTDLKGSDLVHAMRDAAQTVNTYRIKPTAADAITKLPTGGTDPGNDICCCIFGEDSYWRCYHQMSSDPGALCYVPWPECCDEDYTLCP